jgi:hypothetical protein
MKISRAAVAAATYALLNVTDVFCLSFAVVLLLLPLPLPMPLLPKFSVDTTTVATAD